MILKFLTAFLIIFIMNLNGPYAATKSAKVISTRGKVFYIGKGKKRFKLKVGDSVTEGGSVVTKRRSMVKLLLFDKSKISVGPNSKMKIEKNIVKESVGVISLLSGVIRTQVNKNILKKGNKNKLIIKTRTAAMGVRGTDFQVSFNSENGVTNTITYSGEVKMADIKNIDISLKDISKKLGSKRAISIRKGQFSTVNKNISKRATVATKISPVQFGTLKNNKDFSESSNSDVKVKKYNKMAPPGLLAKDVMIGSSAIKAVVGDQVAEVVSKDIAQDSNSPPPEGFVNKISGELAPPAGGFLDLKTGVYVPPPPGSIFDSNTSVYVPPPSFGAVDSKTGEYLPPKGFAIDAKSGEFVEVSINGRDLASEREFVKPVTLAVLANNDLIGGSSYNNATFSTCTTCLPPPPPPPPPLLPPPPPPEIDDFYHDDTLATVKFIINT